MMVETMLRGSGAIFRMAWAGVARIHGDLYQQNDDATVLGQARRRQ